MGEQRRSAEKDPKDRVREGSVLTRRVAPRRPRRAPRGDSGPRPRAAPFALLLQVCGDLPAGVSCSIRLADLFGQSDDDAFRPADVAKPIRVLVLHHFAYQLGPVGEQARDDSVDAVLPPERVAYAVGDMGMQHLLPDEAWTDLGRVF